MKRSSKINFDKLDETKEIIFIDLEFALIEVYFKKNGQIKKTFKTFEVIEMGFLNEKENARYNEFVKPKFKCFSIDQHVKDLTNIKESDLKKGLSYEEVYEKLMEQYVPKKTYIAAWGNGDLPVLKHVCQKNNIHYEILEEDFLDISEMFHEQKNLQNQKLFSLERAVKYLKVDAPKEKHRAISDAESAKNIFNELMRQKKLQKK